MKTIIGIAGRARSGKSTIAQYLKEEYGLITMAFADNIRIMLDSGFLIPDEYKKDKKEEAIPHIGVSYRELCQTLGTEWGRNKIHPDIWVKALEEDIEDLGRLYTRLFVVIHDVRFDNEARWIRDNGELIHVVRPGDNGVRPHVSELGISPLEGEMVFHNDGSIADLFKKVDEWMTRYDEPAE